MNHKVISSIHNPEVKALKRLLSSGKARQEQKVMVLEGIHLVQMCLEHHGEISTLYLHEAMQNHPEVHALAQQCQAVVLSDVVMNKLTNLSRASPILAVCKRPQNSSMPAGASCIILESIQDPGNLGTILRSAAAADVRYVFLSPNCVDVYSPKVLRAAMGAHFVLSIMENADLENILSAFHGRKLITCLDATNSLYAIDLTGSVALVFGNEGSGVSDALRVLADTPIRIPMPGKAESLNVAMAVTICLFERVRQQS